MDDFRIEPYGVIDVALFFTPWHITDRLEWRVVLTSGSRRIPWISTPSRCGCQYNIKHVDYPKLGREQHVDWIPSSVLG